MKDQKTTDIRSLRLVPHMAGAIYACEGRFSPEWSNHPYSLDDMRGMVNEGIREIARYNRRNSENPSEVTVTEKRNFIGLKRLVASSK
jgi:hypothetical protein